MPAATNPNWTPAHESALSGLVGLGISKKEARAFLESMKGGDVATLMRSALAQRNRAQAPPSAVSGGPGGARPIQATPPPLPPSRGQGPPPLPPPTPTPQAGAPKKVDTLQNILNFMMMSPGGGAKSRPPSAPIGPASAQLTAPAPSTAPPGPPAVQQKPRIRIRAAGGRVPPAPIGGQTPSTEATSPTKEAQTPSTPEQPVFISTKKEYDELEPGTEFMWPDGHIYEKPK